MSALYENDFGTGVPLPANFIPGSFKQRTLNANLLAGGFYSLPTYNDLLAIPVDADEGLKLDGITSGGRQLGMVVVITDVAPYKAYQLVVPNYALLPDVTSKVAALKNDNNWQLYKLSDVDKAYVDNAVATQQARIDSILAGSSISLDTFKEVADALAAEQTTTTQILATQSQHTQQITALNNISTSKASIGQFPDFFTPIAVTKDTYYYAPYPLTYIYKRLGANDSSVPFAACINDTVNWKLISGSSFGLGFIQRSGNGNYYDNDSAWRDLDNGSVSVIKGTIINYKGEAYRYLVSTSGDTITSASALNDTTKWKKIIYNTTFDDSNVVHKTGDEIINGLKTFNNDISVNASIYLGNGTDGSGFKIKKTSGNGYIRAFDLTNVGNANSVNFGAVGEGGDLRAHGINFIFCQTGGQAVGKVDTIASSLQMNGRIYSGLGFVGDGSQLTNVPFDDSNLVHKTGNESIFGSKTFVEQMLLNTNNPTTFVATTTNGNSAAPISAFLSPNNSGNIFFAIGNQINQSALFGYSTIGGSQPHAFFTIYGRPETDFTIGANGNVGLGTNTPSERLEVVGNVKALQFIGDGSQLTNLPIPVINDSDYAKINAANEFTAEQEITYNDNGNAIFKTHLNGVSIKFENTSTNNNTSLHVNGVSYQREVNVNGNASIKFASVLVNDYADGTVGYEINADHVKVNSYPTENNDVVTKSYVDDKIQDVEFTATQHQYNDYHPAFDNLKEAVIWLLQNYTPVDNSLPFKLNHKLTK